MTPSSRYLCGAVALVLVAGPAAAFNGHVVTEGPLRIEIGEIPVVTACDVPQKAAVTLRNSGRAELAVTLRTDRFVDECRGLAPAAQSVRVGPGKSASVTFGFVVGKGAESALYPLHVFAEFEQDGKKRQAHAVRIFQTSFDRPVASSSKAPKLRVNVVADGSALPLAELKTGRVAWQHFGNPMRYLPVGWSGSDADSRASLARGPVTRGETMRSITMHPPWIGGAGTIFAEYRLRLPKTRPIRLEFAHAIRDHSATEPPSDGVTFRVWVGEKKLFERHTDSKTWVPGSADLSEFAGRDILLRLESHPGPKNDTTCDSSYWGEPVVLAGKVPPPMSDRQRQALRGRAVAAANGQKHKAGANDVHVFPLAGGGRAAIALGPRGLLDGAIALQSGGKTIVLDGLRLSVLGQPVGGRASPVAVGPATAVGDQLPGVTALRHDVILGKDHFPLTIAVWADGPALRIRTGCPRRLTDVAPGAFGHEAKRVYYGHGYCIVDPEPFRAGFGGHNLSTSHVGFDFAGGLSLLVASDYPPDYLEVNPATRTYALHTHLDATLTFVPSAKGAFDCARLYRPLYDKKPAGGVRRKAGRFVFDIWGGRYDWIADRMKRMFAYGLTDSMLTVHAWQRWGYDYRLPDIYPPAPGPGTVEDMQKIAAVCAAADVPWGLHDNYIDFYPDAEGYSYEHICFTESGRPIKAWINESRDAQSYRWRPDRFMPLLRRNLRLIKPNLKPTAYFIDVFTAIKMIDFYDRQGTYHPMLETRKHWGEAFAWIRDYLGHNAPTSSEAGDDQLTGYLDGADCQFLRLVPEGKRHSIRLRCGDWSRVPWFDAVLHDKFVLHGVGYSIRYQGGRPRREAGIESDDYVSAELLTGHALMIDRGAFGRGAVRKYWLAQDVARRLALDTIRDVTFADGDIHRPIVTWNSGVRIYVNRDKQDWKVAGRVLPPMGYLAVGKDLTSSIERINGVIVEQSAAAKRFYVNGRGFNPDRAIRIRPQADRVEWLGDRRIRLHLLWHAEHPAPKDLAVFVHFVDPAKADRHDDIVFQGDHWPKRPTSQWKGAVPSSTGAVEIPERLVPGTYGIVVGLHDARGGGGRFSLLGEDDGQQRYRVGTLVVEGRGGKVTGVQLVPSKPGTTPPVRWNIEAKPIDFGPAVTTGAFRLECNSDACLLTPLPDQPAFDVTLRRKHQAVQLPAGKLTVEAQDIDGKVLRTVETRQDEDTIQFRTQKDEFAYRIRREN